MLQSLLTYLYVLVIVAIVCNQWQKEAESAVKKLEWVKDIKFEITKYRPRNARAGRFSSLAHVSDIIAVSSCKGGVGKSTVAVNLAFRCGVGKILSSCQFDCELFCVLLVWQSVVLGLVFWMLIFMDQVCPL